MQAVIGALRANLGLDSAQFERGAKRSQSAAQKLQGDLRRMATVAAAAGAALAAMAQRGASEIDRLSKAGQRLNTTVTGMRALELAADEAGVGIGSLTDAVQNLDREVASGSRGAAAALERLGLAASDLEGLEADQKLALIADRVKAMGLSTGQATQLLREFGIRNRDMVLLLMQGGDALRDARSDINDYGLALSQVDAAAVETANDQIGRLRVVGDLLAQNLARIVIPAFGRLAQKITDSMREGGLLRGVINALSRVGIILANAIDIVSENLDFLIKLFAVFVGAKIVLFIGSVGSAMVGLARIIRTTGLVMAAFNVITRSKITTLALVGAVIAEVTGQMDNMIGFLQRTGAAIRDALPAEITTGLDNMRDRIAGLGKDIDSIDARGANIFTGAMAGAGLAADSFGEAARGAGQGVRDLNTDIEETPPALEMARQAFQSFGEAMKSSLEQGFMSIVDGTKTARDAFRTMARDIIAHLYRVFVVQRIVGSFGGGGIMGAVGRAFPSLVPGNANGTTNFQGGMTLVGERGPELVNLPRGSQVLDAQRTSSRMGDGDIIQHFNFNLSANGDESIRRMIAQAAPQIVEAAKSGVIDAKRRGGSYGRAFA
jgi:hypothetical protein